MTSCADVEVAKAVVEGGLLVGRLLSAANDERCRGGVFASGELLDVGAGDYDRAGRDVALGDDRLGACDIDDFCGARKDAACGEDSLTADMAPLDNDGAGADESVVLNDDGGSLDGFEDTADTDTAAEVDTLADLGAAADSGPSVDHGAATDIRADIDKRRHEDGTLLDERAIAGDGMGYGADTHLGVTVLKGNLVVPLEGVGLDGLGIVDGEVEDYGLLDPLIDSPARLGCLVGLGYTQDAFVEEVDYAVYGTSCLGRSEEGTVFPGGFDNLF